MCDMLEPGEEPPAREVRYYNPDDYHLTMISGPEPYVIVEAIEKGFLGLPIFKRVVGYEAHYITSFGTQILRRTYSYLPEEKEILMDIGILEDIEIKWL